MTPGFFMMKATPKLIQLTSIQAMAIRKMSKNNRSQREMRKGLSVRWERMRRRRKEEKYQKKRKLNKSNFPVSKLFCVVSPIKERGINEKAKKKTKTEQKRSFLIKSDLCGDTIDLWCRRLDWLSFGSFKNNVFSEIQFSLKITCCYISTFSFSSNAS